MTGAARRAEPTVHVVTDDEWETAHLLATERWQRHLRRDVMALEAVLSDTGAKAEQREAATHRLASWQAIRVAAQVYAERGDVDLSSRTRDNRPRAVLAHRDLWMRRRLTAALEEQGVRVIASVGDGAAAVVSVVHAQPDLLFVQDALPEVAGHEVALQTSEFSPRTATGLQAESPPWPGCASTAGVQAWFGRENSVVEIAERLVEALQERDTWAP